VVDDGILVGGLILQLLDCCVEDDDLATDLLEVCRNALQVLYIFWARV
jgi:hypothetical protein